jgi:O-antigen/teichoic acid export membrane protein
MASQTKKITLDTLALFSGRAVGLLLGVVRLNYLARYLGLEHFGMLNSAAYFTALFQWLFDLGLSQLLVREIARDPKRSQGLLGTALLLKSAISCLSSVLVFVVALASGFDSLTIQAIMLTTAAVALNGISTAVLSAFQAHRRVTMVSVFSILNDAILSGAIILLIPGSPAVVTVLFLTVGVAAINMGILLVAYKRLFGPPRFAYKGATWLALVREGTPMALSSMGISAYIFIGPTILKYARGDVEVGWYSAGYKLISILTLIPLTFTQVVYPIFSDFFANARDKLEKALIDSLRVITILAVPLAMGTVLLAPKIFAFLFPVQFAPGIVVLQIMVVGVVFGYMDWVLASFFLAIGRQTFLMAISLFLGTAVTVACLIAVPMAGFVALPFVSATNEFLLFVIQIVYVYRLGYRSFSPSVLVRPLIASAVMGIILHLAGFLHLFLLVPLGVIVYGGTLVLIRGLGSQEMTILNRMLERVGIQRS